MKRTTSLKPSRGTPPNALEKRHWNRVAQLGCLVCGAPAELHHCTGHADRMGRVSRRHDRVVPLCPAHHRVGAVGGFHYSVEALGHRGFYEEFGIDLMARAETLWDETVELERRAA